MTLRQERDHLMRMADAGPGTHAYVMDKAERLVRADPLMYAGLVAQIGKHIGPAACVKAEEALKWFRKNA